MADDCGPAESRETCIWTPTNTWTDDSSCSDSSHSDEDACLETQGTCAADDGEVGNGNSHSDKTTCNSKSDCGADASTDQCVWTATNTWTATTGTATTGTQPVCFGTIPGELGLRNVTTDEIIYETVSHAPTSSIMQDVTYLMPQLVQFVDRSYIDKNMYYIGKCDNCEDYIAPISIVSCPCYNDLLIPNPGDCNDMCPSQVGYQGITNKHHADNSYLHTNVCTECAPDVYPDCNGQCPTDKGYYNNEFGTCSTPGLCSDTALLTGNECLAAGTCAAADGVAGNGASYDNDQTTCEAASDCGTAASREQCIFTSAGNTWDGSTCSDGVHNNEADCLAVGTCAAADGVAGTGGAGYNNDETACIAATDCGTPTSIDQCVFTSAGNTWEEYNTEALCFEKDGACKDSSDADASETTKTDCEEAGTCNNGGHTTETDCIAGGSCGDSTSTDKDTCEAVMTCGTGGDEQCVWTPYVWTSAGNTWTPSSTFTFTNHSYVMPDCNNLCPETTCKAEMVSSMSICSSVGQQVPDGRYQNDTASCIANDPKTTDRMCQNDCNGLCWWEDGWTRIDCKIRYHMGYMREDPLYHSNDIYEPPQLTYSESWCPLGQFLSFQKNYINWEEANFKCEVCNRDIFLMHFNTPDSTSGQEHGACCQNMHHKMCGFMMDWYKSACEEDKLKDGATRCSNNLFEFSYISTIQQWTMNGMVVQNLKLRAGYTYIFSRLNTLGNFFANPLRIIKKQDCVGCTLGTVTIDERDQSVYTSWNSLPTSSISNILGGDINHDAVVGKPIYWRPSAEGIYYAISTTSRYLMFRIEVSIH